MPTTLTFRIFKGTQLIREEKLTQNVIKLGKVPSAHLRLDDESVSRMHAIIEVQPNGEVSLIDLGSTRGTFVNGQKINKAKIQSGDTIIVGDTRLELAIELPKVVVAAQATPPPLPLPTWSAPPPVVVAAPKPIMVPARSLLTSTDEGTGAVEIAAMLGDSVVDVKHCVDPNGGKISSTTWGYFAAGVVALISSAAAFALSVHNVAVNKAGLATWVNELHRPAHAFRPVSISMAYDWLAFGGFAVALAALAMGLVRMRREKQRPDYTIGTAPGVDVALEQAPAASFALVSPKGDDFVFNYAPGMEGEMTIDGTSTPLSAMAGEPSLACAGAIELPIPARARIRAKAGQATFLVSAVGKPRAQPTPLFAVESRMLKYAAGSLAVHLGIWAILQSVPQDGTGTNIDLATIEETGTRATITDHELTPEKPVDSDGDPGDKTKTTSGAMAVGPQGTAGDPKTQAEGGGTQIKNNNTDPQLSREQAIQQAREAGIMGSSAMRDSISSLTGSADFSSGFDESNFYGPEFGAYGNGKGTFGMGRTGFGTGGGCTHEPCGLIGSGRYGTIGTGPGGGDGWGGLGGHGGMRRHDATPPGTIIGMPTGTGGLDKAIIKRYVKRASDKIGYCYEKQLLAHPGLAGELMVQFIIQGDGSVKGATGAGFDTNVASCVADVVGSIAFPKPTDGGVVQVNYPFTFRATGA